MVPSFVLLLLAAARVIAAFDLSSDWTFEMPLPYTPSIAQAFLQAHNTQRAFPPQLTANMRKLTWNATLATAAQDHVRQCKWALDTKEFTVGQSVLLNNRPELSIESANRTVAAWMAQSPPMNERGHMPRTAASQVLWATTASLGCASHWCPNVVQDSDGKTGVLTTCYYYPPGNFPDKHVLQLGAPCSACPPDAPYCDATLCTAETPIVGGPSV